MNLLEVVDALCQVTQLQSEIIRKQAETIEQLKISDSTARDLCALRKRADDELRLIGCIE